MRTDKLDHLNFDSYFHNVLADVTSDLLQVNLRTYTEFQIEPFIHCATKIK